MLRGLCFKPAGPVAVLCLAVCFAVALSDNPLPSNLEVSANTDSRMPPNVEAPTSNGQAPTSNGQVPPSNSQAPISNGQAPTLNGQAPISNGQAPTSNGQVPPSNRQAPISNGQVPPSNVQVPTSNGQAPTSNGQVPTSNGQAPTSNGQAPTSNGQVSPSNVQVPTSNGQAPTSNGQAPTSNGQAPTSNGQAPTSNGQAPISNNQPLPSNQVKPTHGLRPNSDRKPRPPSPSPPKRHLPPRVPSFLIPSAESSDAFDGTEASFVYVLPSRARQCFHHRSAKAFQFEFRVLHGGRLDVNVYIVSPSGKITYESRERRLGRFSVPDAPPAAGPAAPADLPVHTICLDNRHSSWYHKLIDFSIHRPPGSRRPNATDSKDAQREEPDDISEELAAELKSLELSWSMFLSLTWSVEDNLQRSASLQRESRGDETQDRLAMEDRAARVSCWSALQLTVMLGVSILQVLMIRSLFDEKSLLHRLWRVRGAFLIGS